jgi:non-heme Fe2+,alpha-ketoglutarate-dependent halogenase
VTPLHTCTWLAAWTSPVTGKDDAGLPLSCPARLDSTSFRPYIYGVDSFTKEARSAGFVSWHQDATYWGLSEPDVVTAWVAFTESTPANGNMRVIPGSHRTPVPHVDTFHPDNLLSRGQEISVEVDESQAADIVLQPGEMSLHHVLMVHGSGANPSSDRRIGFAIRYIPTRLRQTGGPRDSATLVRGADTFGHFEPEPRPATDLDPAMLALHAEISDRQARILYQGTEKTSF